MRVLAACNLFSIFTLSTGIPMRSCLMALLALYVLSGCSKMEATSVITSPTQNTNRTLAYAHSIQIEAEEKRVATIHAAALKACVEAVAEQCLIIESRLNTGRSSSAELKFRARPAGVQKIIAAINIKGEIINQTTTAEDLARPIEDTSKKLAMLQDYLSRLEALRSRASSDIDALIKISSELAKVQSEIEVLTGEKSYLVRRLETETLSISVSARHSKSFSTPISSALSNFLGNLSEGLSGAITAIAYLVPWSLALLVFAWAGRKVWQRWKGPRKNA